MQETQELAVWPSLTAAAPHPTLSTAAAIHPNTNLGAQTQTQTETHKPKHTDTNLETQAQTKTLKLKNGWIYWSTLTYTSKNVGKNHQSTS